EPDGDLLRWHPHLRPRLGDRHLGHRDRWPLDRMGARRPAQLPRPRHAGAVMTPRDLIASYITLAGSGFTEPPRFTFRERCEAASAAGFAGIGIHVNDLAVLTPADVEQILADTG